MYKFSFAYACNIDRHRMIDLGEDYFDNIYASGQAH